MTSKRGKLVPRYTNELCSKRTFSPRWAGLGIQVSTRLWECQPGLMELCFNLYILSTVCLLGGVAHGLDLTTPRCEPEDIIHASYKSQRCPGLGDTSYPGHTQFLLLLQVQASFSTPPFLGSIAFHRSTHGYLDPNQRAGPGGRTHPAEWPSELQSDTKTGDTSHSFLHIPQVPLSTLIPNTD